MTATRTPPTAALALVVVLSLTPSVPSAAPPQRRPVALDASQKKQLNRLNQETFLAAGAGQFELAEQKAREVVALLEKWQGPRHWRLTDARFQVEEWQRWAKVPAKDRAEVMRAQRLRAVGQRLAAAGRFVEAEARQREALALLTKLLGEDHPAVGVTLDHVAGALAGQNKFAQARPLYEKALAIHRKALGELHPTTASGYNNVASALSGEGKLDQALPLYRKALAICLAVLGDDHPSTANSCDALASLLFMLDRPAEAEPHLAKALAIYRAAFGEIHPSTIVGTARLVQCLKAQGKHAEAHPHLEKALANVVALFGEEHVQTARNYNHLAANLGDQGKYALAQPCYEKALAINRKVLGEIHRDTAIACINVGGNLLHQSKNALAQPYLDRGLAILRKVQGEDHPDTAAGYNHAAINLNALGLHDRALALAEKALAIRRKALGEEHPTTASSYNTLASCLDYQGKPDQAQPLYEKALTIRLAHLGERHPSVANSYTNLGRCLDDQGKYGAAQPLLEKALAINRSAVGEEHPETGTCYNNLASCLSHQGKHALAQPLFEKALAIHRKALGEDNRKTAHSYDALALNLVEQGKAAQAQALLERALEAARKSHGEGHPATASSYNTIASNLHKQGKYAQALPFFEKALAIRRKALGEDHQGTTLSYNNVGACLFKLGKHARAQPFLEKAADARRRLLGEDHPDTADSCNDVGANLYALGRHREAVLEWQRALPGQEVARWGVAATGLDRALASSTLAPPQASLALALARLGQPRNACRYAEASLSRGLLDDLSAMTSAEAQELERLTAQLRALDASLLPLLGRSDLSEAQRGVRDERLRQRRALHARRSRLFADVSARQVLPPERIQERLPADAALVFWVEVPHLGAPVACVLRREGPPVWVGLAGTGKDGAWTEQDRDLANRLYRALHDPASGHEERDRLVNAARAQRLAPLGPHLRAKGELPAVRRLLVVPTGSMAHVPVEVLAGDRVVSYVPSGSVLARALGRSRPLSPDSLLALGAPVFDVAQRPPPAPPAHGLLVAGVVAGGNAARAGLRPGDILLWWGKHRIETVDGLKKALAEGPAQVRYWREGKEARVPMPAGPPGVRLEQAPAPLAVKHWRARHASLVPRGTGHAPLPGTEREVNALAGLVKNTTKLLGSAASEEELDRLRKSGRLKRFRLLHFATHGEMEATNPDRCRLILAQDRLPGPLGRSRGQKPYTGELTVQTIRKEWELDCDLVVLSACRTGLGAEALGEGLLGFAQAFLSRGARSVVLTRWQVDDEATALLMVRFYQNLLGKREGLKAPMPKAEALQEAKDWLRNLSAKEVKAASERLPRGKGEKPVSLRKEARPFAHPYYWAAFVLVGDPS